MAITFDENFKGSSMKLSADKLTVTQTPNEANFVRVTKGKTKGKWYWEYKWTKGARASIGIVSSDVGVACTNSAGYLCNEPTWGIPVGGGSGLGWGNWDYDSLAAETGGLVYWTNDIIYRNSKTAGYGSDNYAKSFGASDTVGIALDLDSNQITYYINGVSQGVALGNLPKKEYYAAIASHTAFGIASEASINLGRTPFNYTVPEGFLPYDNEDEPLIDPLDKGFLLRVTMLDSSEREYQLTETEINDFINWFNIRTSTTASSYKLSKKIGVRSGIEYLVFNKIISFEVSC